MGGLGRPRQGAAIGGCARCGAGLGGPRLRGVPGNSPWTVPTCNQNGKTRQQKAARPGNNNSKTSNQGARRRQ